jgi:hypothetical protein
MFLPRCFFQDFRWLARTGELHGGGTHGVCGGVRRALFLSSLIFPFANYFHLYFALEFLATSRLLT